MPQASDAILRLTDGTDGGTVDLLGPESGWKLADPYWRPQIAQYKGGGFFADSALADGRGLVYSRYANVVEQIPLSVRGRNQDMAIQTVRKLLQLMKQAGDFWKEAYEYDDVWLEARPPCDDCFTGYARVIHGSVPELDYPFGQPFFAARQEAVMEGITLVVEREPFWRGTEPGTIIGPLYNHLRNPDFELWTQQPGAVADVEPDNWSNLESLWVTGTNNREDAAVRHGQYCLRVNVSGSTLAGAVKGVTQVAPDTEDETTYTAVAWVRNAGVDNGVGRILVTYSDQFELYRSAEAHGWTLYARSFTTDVDDVVAVSCEILTTDPNTDGTVWFDGLMLLRGDWVSEADDGVLPQMSGSHIVNHWDQPGGAVVTAGDINWVDVWDVPGDLSALVRLEFVNNTEPADFNDPIERYAEVRVGMRRALDLTLFDNYHDPVGVNDAACSSDDRIESAGLTGDWSDFTTKLVTGGENTRNTEGRFRLFARVYDPRESGNPTIQARMRYWIGAGGVNDKILTGVDVPVRAQWCMLDLTPRAAMNQVAKHSDPAAQMGYTVQLRRKLGADAGYLDYAMAMPTDGGYLEAEPSPSIGYRNSLVVDNTRSQSVKASYTKAAVSLEYATDEASPAMNALATFRGDLYVGGDSNAGGGLSRTAIWRRRAGVYSKVYTGDTDLVSVEAMAVFNDTLYAGVADLQGPWISGWVIASTDGVSWSKVHDVLTVDTQPIDMVVFAGKLWMTTEGAGGASSTLESYDGSVWVVVRDFGAALVRSVAVYNNRLFIAEGNNLWSYDTETGLWTNEAAVTTAQGMIDFRGRLYIGGGGIASLCRVFDGATVGTSGVVEGIPTDQVTNEFAILNEVLYAYMLINYGAGLFPYIYATEDGDTWSKIWGPGPVAWTNGDIEAFEGQLYFTTSGAAAGGRVYTYSGPQDAAFYNVTDYRGVPFTSPPEKRHRFFFNYDRDGSNNVVDDKALIGLGFVPRYLALRGRG